jgi:peptidyl-prolyl cis-trans isomerase C
MKNVRTILREPLVQFLLIALVLFAVNRFVDADLGGAEPSKRIELTANDLRQMTMMWLAQGRPMPSKQQLRAMMEQRVGLEVLSREALALGLDRNDEIITRYTVILPKLDGETMKEVLSGPEPIPVQGEP